MAVCAAAESLLADELGGRMQARRGELVDVLDGEGLVADLGPHGIVGVITWQIDGAAGDARAEAESAGTAATKPKRGVTVAGADAEVRALAVATVARGRGIGRALLQASEEALRAAGVRRAWLVTTNDNLAALALYQKAGWRLSKLRPGRIDEMRRTIKPGIGSVGQHGIPLRDELELSKDI